MQIKTYLGVSTQDLLAQIKTELGPEAIILSSRDFRKDGERWHEVTAGIDRPVGVLDALHRTGNGTLAPTVGAVSVGNSMGGDWGEWQKDWLQIREHIYSLMLPSIQWERLSPRQRVALEFMRREGVDGWVLMDLYQRLASSPGASILEALSALVSTRPWSAEEWTERIHIMCGAFGSGKTISALRMALLLRQTNPDMNIAFINADCERGNGRLVLRHWAELSGFTYLEAVDAHTMRAAMQASRYCERVFVDLPGITREGSLAELLAVLGLGSMDDAVVHLTLSPMYSVAHGQALLERYQSMLPGSLIWTKLDESDSYGSMINLCASCGLSVSALSYGSALHNTLAPATESLIWRLVFKRQLPGSG